MFKAAAVLVGILNLLMGAVWFFAPHFPLELWGVTQTSHGLMVERRLGIVILIYSVVLLLARNAPPSPARSAICYAAVFGGIAIGSMNLYDLVSGTASSGVASAIGINYLTSLAFGLIEWRAYRDRKPADTAKTPAQ
ncbi:MAG: hypothetical protein E6Q50_01305 [Lysobacter sp.]|nr:MAG: hypothetical protein E6Q50_01305 [Lysobacter sp.]